MYHLTDYFFSFVTEKKMATKFSLKKLQRRVAHLLLPSRPHHQPIMAQERDASLISLESELPFSCCNWINDLTTCSVQLSTEDYTLEYDLATAQLSLSSQCDLGHHDDVTSSSVQLSRDDYSTDDLHLSQLTAISGSLQSQDSNSAPLNSTRLNDPLDCRPADLTCSDLTSMTSSSRDVPPPSQPTSPVAMTMTRERKRNIRKNLKRVGLMLHHGRQDHLTTLAVIWSHSELLHFIFMN